MSIIVVKEIVCDHCGYSERLDGNLTEEWLYLKKEGWARKFRKHFCPSCNIKNEMKIGIM